MTKKLTIISLLGLTLITTTACSGNGGHSFRPSMYDGTVTTQRDIEIEQQRFVDKKPVNDVTYDYLMGLSDDYDHHGDSPVYIVLGYNPDVKNAKLSTYNKSNILKGQLAKLGMRDAVVKTMPIVGSTGEAVIGYDRVIAKGPENCGEVPGLTTETGSYGDYGLGCTYKNAMAKQIAYPKDLEGPESGMGKTAADRTISAVNVGVRSGEPSPFVPSYILSELGGNTSE